MRTLLISALVIGFGFACENADATIIGRNLDAATTVFADNGFESDTLGTNPSNASVGEWSVTGQVANVVDDVSPGPFVGSQYLHVYRESAPEPVAVFNSSVGGGDTVAFTFAMNHTGMYPGVVLKDGGTEVARIQGDDGGNYRMITEAAGGGGAWENSGLASTLSQWQVLTMTWDTDGSLFRLTVDGSSYDYAGLKAAAAVDRVLFRTDDGGAVFYLDAVPEPSALIMIVCGAGALLFWRRRR